jgi:DNA repair protein RAD50
MRIDLLEPKYKDIEKKLLDLNVKYLLTRDLSSEVQEKHDALDEALMQYHAEKMKEINKTLSDFWKMTYNGDDIQTIMIKTDVDKGSAQAKLRSYNYRIVLQTPDGMEMDMKGRCSAG